MCISSSTARTALLNSCPLQQPDLSNVDEEHSNPVPDMQAPPMASRLYSTQKGQGAPKDGPEQLLLLLDHLQNVAGNSSSSAGGSAAGTPAAYFEAVKTTLLAGCKPQDKWRLVQCGEWEDYKDWSGPARTLMQFWATDAPRDEYARLTLAYNIWEIGPDGLPTGETFRSGTGECQRQLQENTRCWPHFTT